MKCEMEKSPPRVTDRKRKRETKEDSEATDITQFFRNAGSKPSVSLTAAMGWKNEKEMKKSITQAPTEITKWMGFGGNSSPKQILQNGIKKLITNSDSGYADDDSETEINYAIIKNGQCGKLHLPTAMRFLIWYHAQHHCKNKIQVIDKTGKDICVVELDSNFYRNAIHTKNATTFRFNKI